MKISELAVLLTDFEQQYGDMEIVMSQDSEGNGYSPFSDLGVGKYFPEEVYFGAFYSKEDLEEEPEEYPDPAAGVDAVCLWPCN